MRDPALFWILGTAVTISLAILALAASMFRAAIRDIKAEMKENRESSNRKFTQLQQRAERLEMQVNANAVSIAKVEAALGNIKDIKDMMQKHLEFHQAQEDRIRQFYMDYQPALDYAKKMLAKE